MQWRAREDPLAAALSRIPCGRLASHLHDRRAISRTCASLCSAPLAMEPFRPCDHARDVRASWRRSPHWRPRLPDPRSARMWERQHPPFDLPRGVPSRPGPARRSHGDDPPTTRQNRGRPTSVRAGGDRRGASGRRPPTRADPCGHRLLPLGSSPHERSQVSSSGTQRAFLSRHSSHPQHGS
jgi:hypothetical protein